MARFASNHWKVWFQLPLRKNDGSLFPADVWLWWRARLTLTLNAIKSGNTALNAHGTWQGKEETNILYFVTVDDESAVEQIRALLLEALGKFDQQKIYFDAHPVYFELLG